MIMVMGFFCHSGDERFGLISVGNVRFHDMLLFILNDVILFTKVI